MPSVGQIDVHIGPALTVSLPNEIAERDRLGRKLKPLVPILPPGRLVNGRLRGCRNDSEKLGDAFLSETWIAMRFVPFSLLFGNRSIPVSVQSYDDKCHNSDDDGCKKQAFT